MGKVKMPKRKSKTKRELLASCKSLGVNANMHMTKRSLRNALSRCAVCIIQKAMRRHILTKKQLANDVDPITLEPVDPARRWLVRERECVYQFDAHSMVEYIGSEGVYQNPLTRCEFTDQDLDKLEAIYYKTGGDATTPLNLASRRRDVRRQRAEERESERVATLLAEECVDVMKNILDLCGECSVPLINQNLDEFFLRIADLAAVDNSRAMMCLVDCVILTAHVFGQTRMAITSDLIHAVHQRVAGHLRESYNTFVDSPIVNLMANHSRLFFFIPGMNLFNPHEQLDIPEV